MAFSTTGAHLVVPLMFASASPELVEVTAPEVLSWGSSPFASSTQIIEPDAAPAPPRALAELLQLEPGLAYSGQGGLFQTISVRGMSRQRVGNYFLDIPLFTERRAGTAASFIDPSLLGPVELVRGPSSVVHGFGAIGGLVHVRPQINPGTQLQLGWGNSGDENLQAISYGSDSVDAALVHRGANNSESAAGEPLNNGFDQYNLLLGGRAQGREVEYSAHSLLTWGEDIGKSNALYPHERVTSYPRERHWLNQVTAERQGLWRASAFLHVQDLDTRVERIGERINEVENQSLDFGFKGLWLGDTRQSPFRLGVDYLGRRKVDAQERQTSAQGSREWDLLQGERDDLAVYADLQQGYPWGSWVAGVRLAHLWQRARHFDQVTEFYGNAFAGIEWDMFSQGVASVQLSAGQRPASLSERFFSGTTGRGVVIGNPALDVESSVNLDLGYEWRTEAALYTLSAFYTELDDLIERVAVGEDVLSYRNVSSGDIHGVELSLQRELGESWTLSAGGHYQQGEDGHGQPLQDQAPDKLFLGLAYGGYPWSFNTELQYRFAESDVAATEQPVDSARLLSASLAYQLGEKTSLRLWTRNLLNDEYLTSTDRLSAEGQERAVGIQLHWRSPP